MNKRKHHLPNIITAISPKKIIINTFKQNLKSMSENTIHDIYSDLDVTGFNPTITMMDPIGDRKIIKVNDGEVYFYKSSGKSRRQMANTKGIWFPCLGNCMYPDNSLSEKRIRKLEDPYLNMTDSVITDLLKTNPDLLKYRRFITKENAMISKKLFLTFSSNET